MPNAFDAWLAAWSEERGFGPIRLDEDGFAALEDDAGLIIGLYFSRERGTLKTIADLGLPPETENAANFYEWLLINNFGASVEREGILARAGETGHLLFIREWAVNENASAELLNVFLQQTSLLGNQWRDRITAAPGDEDDYPLGNLWRNTDIPALPEHHLPT